MKKNLLRLKILFQSILFLIIPSSLFSSPVLFDMGTGQSSVYDGFRRVTIHDKYSEVAGFGWKSSDNLAEQEKAFTQMVFNAGLGFNVPPNIWTNPITEDAIIGSSENSFIFGAPAGSYHIYIVCGTSQIVRNQYYDFTVKVGSEQKRVQFEGGQQFHSLKFHIKKGSEPVTVQFSPLNKFVVNAIMAWSDSEDATVQKNLITPFEEFTYRMPPEQWAKWKLDQVVPDGEPVAGKADQKRGYIVWSHNYLDPVYQRTQPKPEEYNPSLSLFASQGEYEPTNFIIYPLKDLSSAKVTVSSIGPVPAQNIDVRHVRFYYGRVNYVVFDKYRIIPDILDHFTTIDLKKGENSRFWITIKVPENAPAGSYTGKITFECSGGKTVIPVSLRIMPIKLKEDPSKIYGIYYRNPIDQTPAADKVSDDYFRHKAEMEHADMVEHGTRNVTLSFSIPPADEKGNFNFDFDLFAQKMDLWKKYNFKGPVALSINTSGIYEKYMGERYGNHMLNIKIPPVEMFNEVTAMVKALEAERKRRGWPEFLLYPMDEPGRDSTSIVFMSKLLKACKDAGVRTYLTANPMRKEFQALKPYVDVWCTQPFLPDRETVIKENNERGVEYWCYPNHVAGENDHTVVVGSRMTYGFGFWRSGFRTLIPWIYSYREGDPFNNLDGYYPEFFNHYEPDGTPLPVVMWEAYREGYDDYRYIYTLEQLIEAAKKSGNAEAQKKAEIAEKELTSIWNDIKVLPKYMDVDMWEPNKFDQHRLRIANQILELQNTN